MPRRPHPAYVAYRIGSALARVLPGRSVPAVSALAGRVAAARLGSRRLIVERNLRRVRGDDLSEAEVAAGVQATFASYAHYWIESFRLPGTSAADLARGMTAVGMEHVKAGRAAGTGTILALPHLGGWEWAAFWMSAVEAHPFTAVVEQIEPPELAEWFVGLRRQLGMEVVTLGPSAASACVRALKENGVVALICDRDLTGTGVEVEMFGERTTLPGGPATLALRTGAPLVPAAVAFDIGGRHLAQALPALDTERRGSLRADVARVTQELAAALETLIRRAPDQWHLLQPNWPSDHAALAAAGFGPELSP